MSNLTKTLKALSEAAKLNATHPNHEGAPSYYRSLKEQVVQVLSTGTLGDTFYASGKELAADALHVLVEARAECPEFLARASVWARNEGCMKLLPVLGLAVLSGGAGKTKKLFTAAFPRVVLTPDDLRSFIEIAKSGVCPGRKGLGGMTVAPVREFLLNISEYHAVKYGSESSKGITLRDAIRLAHPRAGTAEMEERLGWIVKGRKGLRENSEANLQIRALEALKRSGSEAEIVALVREGRLPFEAVIPAVPKMTLPVWEELLHQAPYMNLLMNLETFTRHGVFEKEENVRFAVAKLTNPQAIARSKILPFRFWNAWKVYSKDEKCDSRIADALRDALELSFVNMPSLGEGPVAIGTDVSGSMGNLIFSGSEEEIRRGQAPYVSRSDVPPKSGMRYIDVAGIFTGVLLHKTEGRVIPLPFEGRLIRDHGLSSRDDILTTVEKVARIQGGSTAVGAPIQYLLDHKIKVDTFIGITDNVDWAHATDTMPPRTSSLCGAATEKRLLRNAKRSS